MRSRSLMLIMISLGCGAVAAVGMLQVLSQKTADVETEEKAPVLVALTDLEIKDELTPENVQVEYYPLSLVPDGVVSTWEEGQGKKIMARVHRGMPIMSAMLYDKHQISDVIVPEGYNIIAMKVDKQDSFHGLLKAGDRVDIIGVLKKDGQNTAKTFLKNVQVYAVDNKTDRIPDAEDSPRTISTVQLVVNQAQAEKLALYENLGSIRFTMGSDTGSNVPELVDDSVADSTPSPAPIPTIPSSNGLGGSLVKQAASGFWSLLERSNENRPAAAQPTQSPQHVMTVFLGDGQETTYEWSKDGGTMRVQGGSGIVPSSQPSSAAVPVASTPNPINPNNSDSNSHNEPADGSTSVDYDEEDADY